MRQRRVNIPVIPYIAFLMIFTSKTLTYIYPYMCDVLGFDSENRMEIHEFSGGDVNVTYWSVVGYERECVGINIR